MADQSGQPPLTDGLCQGNKIRLTIDVEYMSETPAQIGFQSDSVWPLGVIWIDRESVISLEKA